MVEEILEHYVHLKVRNLCRQTILKVKCYLVFLFSFLICYVSDDLLKSVLYQVNEPVVILMIHPLGGSVMYQARRPRSTSVALSTSFNEELLNNRVHRDSHSSHKNRKDTALSTTCVPALISTPHSADADIGKASLDFDPISFQCSTTPTEASMSEERKRGSRRKTGGSSSESETLKKVTLTRPSDVIPTISGDTSHKHPVSAKFAPTITGKEELKSSQTAPVGLTQKPEVLEMKTLSVPPTEMLSPLVKPSEITWGQDCQNKPSSLLRTEAEVLDETRSEETKPVKQKESG